ncbi:hypothetical protein [Niallia endozanthoxylica]|uniref:Uncharacterized protein n=1 Tax=Niallia endozanthoxylica TaxID=2036016 RepID=A0A5J5HQY0_9BACI|nr:hypothetical protein [Niallia endozanthoxylica]KAA9023591.1 hypothetical protein F4V44_13085 [Niallia endozanthoxylica]
MKNEDKHYIYYTSIGTSENQDEFLLELFTCSENDEEHIVPETVIHNFDELITFFENMEQ